MRTRVRSSTRNPAGSATRTRRVQQGITMQAHTGNQARGLQASPAQDWGREGFDFFVPGRMIPDSPTPDMGRL